MVLKVIGKVCMAYNIMISILCLGAAGALFYFRDVVYYRLGIAGLIIPIIVICAFATAAYAVEKPVLTQAQAQKRPVICVRYDMFAEKLKAEFGERKILSMKHERGQYLELWGNIDTGTWTMSLVTGDEAAGTRACNISFQGRFLKIGEM